MNIFFKTNNENVVTAVITSDSQEMDGYFLSPANHSDIMGATWDPINYKFTSRGTELLSVTFGNVSTTMNELEQSIRELLDKKSISLGYDSIVSAVSYVNSTNDKYRAEAVALSEWRDQVWQWLYTQFDDINIGDNPVVEIPLDVLLSQVPVFTLTV